MFHEFIPGDDDLVLPDKPRDFLGSSSYDEGSNEASSASDCAPDGAGTPSSQGPCSRAMSTGFRT